MRTCLQVHPFKKKKTEHDTQFYFQKKRKEKKKEFKQDKMTFLLQRNAMKWKKKLLPNNVMRDSVMQISIGVMLKRDFGGNTTI